VHPDEHQDVLVPEAEAPDQPQADAHPRESNAWDASDAARPDATDAGDLRRAPADEGAEKVAVPAPDARGRDASSLRERWPVRWVRRAVAAELCTRDAVRSAEQSCAAREAAAGPQLLVLPLDAAQPPESAEQPRPSPRALRVQAARSQRPEGALLGAAASQLAELAE
jgi:hypothetical protein